MLPDKDVMCHRTGFQMSCRDGVVNHSCQLWTQIIGKHPQTGSDIDHSGCADKMMPLIMIENSRMQNHTAAAIESFRDEMIKLNQVPLPLLER